MGENPIRDSLVEIQHTSYTIRYTLKIPNEYIHCENNEYEKIRIQPYIGFPT